MTTVTLPETLSDLSLALRLLEAIKPSDTNGALPALPRLRLCPSLWEAIHHPPCLEAVLSTLPDGRPADWAHACLSALVHRPADDWLAGQGQPLTAWALEGLPLQALPAPVRDLAHDWAFVRPLALAYALQHHDAPWGERVTTHGALLAAQPEAVAMLVAGTEGSEAGGVDASVALLRALLAAGAWPASARALATNYSPTETGELLGRAAPAPAEGVALSHELAALGFPAHATAVAVAVGAQHPPPVTPIATFPATGHAGDLALTLARQVNAALLTAACGRHDEAHRALTIAEKTTRILRAALAAALADLAHDKDGNFSPDMLEKAARQAVEADPAAPAYRMRLAALQLEAGRPDDALETLVPLMTDRPDRDPYPQVRLLAARAHLARGDDDDACTDVQHALESLESMGIGGDSAPALAIELSQLAAELGDLEGALAAAVHATASAPWSADAWFNLAERHHATRNFSAAADAYAQAAVLAPKRSHMRTRLGVCLVEAGRPDEAAQQFEAALALTPNDPHAAVGLARLALAAGDPERAAEIARQALAHNPENGALYDVLADALQALGREDLAAEQYAQATRHAPGLARPWLALAAHQQAKGAHDQALATLEAAADALPNNAKVLAALADAYQTADQYQAARATLARALPLAPADDRLITQYGTVLRVLGEAREALRVLKAVDDEGAYRIDAAYQTALAHESLDEHAAALEAAQIAAAGRLDHAPFHVLVGRLALRLDQPDLAVEALRTAIDLTGNADDSDNAELYHLLGQAYQALADAEQAMLTHGRALRLQPTNPAYHRAFGLAARAAGAHETAAAALREAVSAQPADAEAQLALGLSLEVCGCWDDAAEALRAASRHRPDDPIPYQALGRVAMHRKDPQGAIAALRRALALDPEHTDSYRRLGEAYAALGQADEALRAFRQVLARRPDDAALHAAVGRALEALGAHAEAVPVLERARALAPADASTHAAVCRALSQATRALDQMPRALEAMRAAITIEPEDPAHYVALGELLVEAGDTVAAADAWTLALSLNPEDTETRRKLVAICDALGRSTVALEVAAPLLDDDFSPAMPGVADLDLLRRAARWALDADDVDRAGYLVARALTCDANDAALHALGAEVSTAAGEPLRALASLRYAIELDPRTADYRVRLAELLLSEGRPAEAYEEAQHALALGVEAPAELLALGRLFNKMYRWSAALPLLTKAIEADPESAAPWLEMGRARVAVAKRALQLAEAGVTREQLTPQERRSTLRVVEQAISLGAEGASVTVLHGQALSLLDDANSLEAALDLLEEAYAAAPSSHTRLALGEAHLRAGRLDEAARHLTPPGDQLHLELARLLALGELHTAQGDATRAHAALKQAAEVAPGNPVVQYHLAQAATALGRRGQAVEALDKAVSLVTRVPAWQHQLGALLLEMGQTARAEVHLQQAVELEPDNPDYLVGLARVRREMGDAASRDSAIGLFETAVKLQPASAAWWAELGALHEVRGEAVPATQCYKHALKLDETHLPALLGLAAGYLEMERAEQALKYAQRAGEAAPDDAEVQKMLAACAAQVGDVESAAWHYERAAALGAASGESLLALGQLYSDAGQWSKAVDALRRNVRAAPTDAGYAALARACAHLEQFKEAIEAARRAAEAAPDDASHWRYLGGLLRQQDQPDEALVYLGRARAMDPDDAATYHEIGRVHEARQEHAPALEAYRAAIDAAPDEAEHYFRAGVVLKHMKDYSNAAKMLNQAVRLDPSKVEAHKQLATVSALGFVSNTPVGMR